MIQVNTIELQTALSFLQFALGSSAVDTERSKCIFFKQDEKSLFIFTSTQNVSISYELKKWTTDDEVKIDIAFDGKKFKHLIDNTSKESIFLKKNETKDELNQSMITWEIKGRGNYNLKNFKFGFEDCFYKEELNEKEKLFSIKTDEISKAMGRSIFFVGEERQDPHLRNFCFDGNLVASDRKSIHLVETSLKDKIKTKILLPQVFYDICRKFTTENVDVYDKASYYVFTDSIYRVRIPRISGSEKFPDYSKYIDECLNYPNFVEFSKNDFHSIINTLSFFTSEYHFNKIEFKVKKNKIHLLVQDEDILEEELNCTSNDFEVEFSLNSKYLLKAIEVFDTDRVKLMINTFKDPIFLQDSKSKILLAPVTIKKDDK